MVRTVRALENATRISLLIGVAWVRPAAAAPFAAAGVTAGSSLGSPAVDFSPGGGVVAGEAAVYFWVDERGVTHFTDRPGELLGRFREHFRPIDLFVNTAGQPKR